MVGRFYPDKSATKFGHGIPRETLLLSENPKAAHFSMETEENFLLSWRVKDFLIIADLEVIIDFVGGWRLSILNAKVWTAWAMRKFFRDSRFCCEKSTEALNVIIRHLRRVRKALGHWAQMFWEEKSELKIKKIAFNITLVNEQWWRSLSFSVIFDDFSHAKASTCHAIS